MSHKVEISKLDAAKRQLEMAIRLFFTNSDIVSTHTLAAAANEVLSDLCDKKQLDSMKKEMLNSIKLKHRKEVLRRLREPQNYFKHAEKDHDKLLSFNPDFIEYILFQAIDSYKLITKDEPPLHKVFYIWFFSKHIDAFVNGEYKDQVIKAIKLLKLDYNNKVRYLQELLPEIIKVQ